MALSDWIPLIQTAIWVVFIGVLLFAFRSYIRKILSAIIKNVEAGSALETPWLKFGQRTPKQVDALVDNPSPIDKLRSVYIRHSLGDWEQHQDGVIRRPVEIWIDSFDDTMWDNIEKVTFFFPLSFPQRKFTRTNKEEWFSIKTSAIGEFSVGAELILSGTKEPIRINRYIDFSESSKKSNSETSIPIVHSDKIYGVLDIQSARPSYDNSEQLARIKKPTRKKR